MTLSIHLQELIRNFDYKDGYLLSNPKRIGYTWHRPGRKGSRLDRAYIPASKVSDVHGSVEHHSHLSDHDAIVFLLRSTPFLPRPKFSSGYWK